MREVLVHLNVELKEGDDRTAEDVERIVMACVNARGPQWNERRNLTITCALAEEV